MSKLQDIRELAQEHATLVSSSPRDWMSCIYGGTVRSIQK